MFDSNIGARSDDSDDLAVARIRVGAQMPRATRVFFESGLYHVYNRFARGDEVFADPGGAIGFIHLLRGLKLRDGFQVVARSPLSNHYHLAVRMSAVPLARTMGTASGEDRRTAGEAFRCGQSLGTSWSGEEVNGSGVCEGDR